MILAFIFIQRCCAVYTLYKHLMQDYTVGYKIRLQYLIHIILFLLLCKPSAVIQCFVYCNSMKCKYDCPQNVDSHSTKGK